MDLNYSDLWPNETPVERAQSDLKEEKRKAKKVKMSENDVREISRSRDHILHRKVLRDEIKALRREIQSITLWSLIKKIWS